MIECQQPQRVPHQHGQSRRPDSGITQPTQNEGESRQTEIGFRLTTASWEEQQVDNPAIRVPWLRNSWQVHQYERQLERSPSGLHIFGSLALNDPKSSSRRLSHRLISKPERFEAGRIAQQVDTALDAISSDPSSLNQLQPRLTPLRWRARHIPGLAVDPFPIFTHQRTKLRRGIRAALKLAERVHG